MRVLVTGASGFVGRAVVARLALDEGTTVRAATRRPAEPLPPSAHHAIVGDLATDTDWRAALEDVDAIVHAAARVHVMHDDAADPLAEFRRVNVEGTVSLARQAAAAGVRRFVFVSSIKVNGEATTRGRPFRADDAAAPIDPYGVSKHEAEIALRSISAQTGMEVTVVRPVLVYGPGVRGNFRSMIEWVRRGAPLPLGGLDNRRSLVALDNLVDLLVTCARHPAAANRTFLVSDGDDVSTAELLRRVAQATGRGARLVPVPAAALRVVGALVGASAQVQRLCGDLQVDIGPTRKVLGWEPLVNMADALRHMVAAGD
jgi:nucleoside-diphosphate-sugar epimerase